MVIYDLITRVEAWSMILVLSTAALEGVQCTFIRMTSGFKVFNDKNRLHQLNWVFFCDWAKEIRGMRSKAKRRKFVIVSF